MKTVYPPQTKFAGGIKIYLHLHNFNIWPLNPTTEVKGVCKIQSVTLHVGLHLFHFNLRCNMTIFKKEKEIDLLT